MKKTAPAILVIICIALIPAAFFAGLRLAGQRLKDRSLQLLQDDMVYNSSVYNAANYGQLLLQAREGEMTSLVTRLEHLTDMSFLMASAATNAIVQAVPDGPWYQLRADRLAHPRQMSTDREKRISDFLDRMIQEGSATSGSPTAQPRAPQP
jgi:hypothetical protein